MDKDKKIQLIKLFAPAGITFIVLLLLTIWAGTWKFEISDIIANFVLIFMFSGIAFVITCIVLNSQKAKAKKAEALRIAEEQRRFEAEQARLRAEEEQRKYNEWFSSLSEAEKQTELQRQYYQNQLRLDQENLH